MRMVRGVRGRVAMRTELVVRFDYGAVVPWVSRQEDGRLHFTAGPDRLTLATPVELRGEDLRTVGEFEVGEGDEVTFSLTWQPSWRADLPAPDAAQALARGARRSGRRGRRSCPRATRCREAVRRSLVTLKALAHWETGGIVAAATTSLPEKIGGTRNWDYRFCWLRDATFTLYALLRPGLRRRGRGLARLAGARRRGQPRRPADHVRRGRRAPPRRVRGALAARLRELARRCASATRPRARCSSTSTARCWTRCTWRARPGLAYDERSWAVECAMVAHLEAIWDEPDDGIWEVRGGRRHFTHSKVMAWVAFDRAVRSAERVRPRRPGRRTGARCATRSTPQVCERGFDADAELASCSRTDRTALDASLLLIPLVGFLPPDDPRVRGTLAAHRARPAARRPRAALRHRRFQGRPAARRGRVPGLHVLAGRQLRAAGPHRRGAGAVRPPARAIATTSGLLAEEYDPVAKRQLGNFPQAFSHLALINTATGLAGRGGHGAPAAAGSGETKG